MSQQLISLSADLRKLQMEHYSIEIRSGYLLLHNVPYLNSARQVARGTLVSELTLVNNTTTARPGSHVVFFTGDFPRNKDGSLVAGIQHGNGPQQLAPDIITQHSFSNKPQTGYTDYYAKMTRYAEIISAPAKSIDPTLTEKTTTPVAEVTDPGVFQYIDTNSSRANVTAINAKLADQKIAIVGLGGTGSYILDLVAKTPVQEIHLFDGDDFLQHNAFRSPGAASLDDLEQRSKKVEYYARVYSRMHKGIRAHPEYISADNLSMMDGASFVFLCVDRNKIRGMLAAHLTQKGISFVDVGMGVLTVDDCLIGTLRYTAGTAKKNDHLGLRLPAGGDDADNPYSTNIQIADLNALNAAFAVIKWKKLVGFYQDLEQEHHSTYSINVAQLINEDFAA
jgi:ThiF family